MFGFSCNGATVIQPSNEPCSLAIQALFVPSSNTHVDSMRRRSQGLNIAITLDSGCSVCVTCTASPADSATSIIGTLAAQAWMRTGLLVGDPGRLVGDPGRPSSCSRGVRTHSCRSTFHGMPMAALGRRSEAGHPKPEKCLLSIYHTRCARRIELHARTSRSFYYSTR